MSWAIASQKSLHTGQQLTLPQTYSVNEPAKLTSAKGLICITLLFTAVASATVATGIFYSTTRPRNVDAVAWSALSLWTRSHAASGQPACLRGPQAAAAAAAGQDGSHCSYPWEITMNASAAIPVKLWQTSRSSSVSGHAKTAMQTWQNQNPNVSAVLHDDAAAAAFIQDFYGAEAYTIFSSFPLGVMRGDFWRYAVLYAYGGIYADIDTQCLKPIQQWFPPRRQQPGEHQKFGGSVFVSEGDWQSAGGLDYHRLSWDDCSIVIALENEVHFCQWIIASVAGHPVLKEVLHMMLDRAKHGINITYEHMVHHHTGPGIWTQAILKVLGLNNTVSAAQAAKAVWTDPAAYRRARSMGICIVAASFWGTRNPQNALNMYGSLVFKDDEGYPKWTEERAELLKRAAEQAAVGAQGGVPAAAAAAG